MDDIKERIMKIAGCSLEEASKIKAAMYLYFECNFSEWSWSKIDKTIKQTIAYMKEDAK